MIFFISVPSAAETESTKDAIEEQAPGGFYQDGVYFYPVPQDSVDNIYRVCT